MEYSDFEDFDLDGNYCKNLWITQSSPCRQDFSEVDNSDEGLISLEIFGDNEEIGESSVVKGRGGPGEV